MSTDLEKFVHKNREDFDSAAPSGKVWEDIEQSLPAKKEARRFSLRDIFKWSAAAAIFFIVLTSVYFLFIRKHGHENQTVNNGMSGKIVDPDDIGSIAPEFAIVFRQVYQSVKDRQMQLRSVASGQPELYRQFMQDLKVLDSSYRMLTVMVPQSPNRDVIIKAMIQNLQLQAELLARQLLITEEFKNIKNLKNEKDL